MLKKITAVILSLSLTSYAGGYVKLKKPPKSLDNYFPPKSEKPIFLYNMHNASTAFTGVFVNIKQGNWDNALKWSQKLKSYYFKIGKMVPEWNKFLRKEEMEKLIDAVKNKDISKVEFYAKKIGQSCAGCHKKYMLPVKIKYHYPSYRLISLEDPVSGNEYSIEKYMKKLSTDYKLIKVFLDDGKFPLALKAADNFRKRYKGLTQMCSECHTNKAVEDIYFNKQSDALLDKLIKFIQNKQTQKTLETVNSLGGNCYKCHNVHEVPYLLKEKFEK